MFECRLKSLESPVAHDQLLADISPSGNYGFDFAQDLPAATWSQAEVFSSFHQSLDACCIARSVQDPGLESALLVWKRTEIESGPQAPLSILDMEKPHISQTIIPVGDKNVQRNAAPQLFAIDLEIGGMREESVDDITIGTVFRSISHTQ